MFLLLGVLEICISSVKLYVRFLCKLASSLTAVIIRASISSRTLFSISPVLATVLLNICLLFLSNWSELKLYIKRLSTFLYKLSFDINLWMPSFSLSLPRRVNSNLKFGIMKFCWCSLPVLQTPWNLEVCTKKAYTGCPRRNGQNFGRVFLMLNYTDITQNTYVQSWTVTEIMVREFWNFDSCYSLIDYQIHIETGRNMWFL